MKRLALLAAVVLFAACAPKGEETSSEMAAPAATDSAATMTDSTMTDSTTMDSTATKAM